MRAKTFLTGMAAGIIVGSVASMMRNRPGDRIKKRAKVGIGHVMHTVGDIMDSVSDAMHD